VIDRPLRPQRHCSRRDLLGSYYEELELEVGGECNRFAGAVLDAKADHSAPFVDQAQTPRGQPPVSLGSLRVLFRSEAPAWACAELMHGRFFDGRRLQALVHPAYGHTPPPPTSVAADQGGIKAGADQGGIKAGADEAFGDETGSGIESSGQDGSWSPAKSGDCGGVQTLPQGGEPGEDLWYDPLAGSMAAKLAQLEEEAKRAEEAEHEKQRLRMLELERQALANESKADKALRVVNAKLAKVPNQHDKNLLANKSGILGLLGRWPEALEAADLAIEVEAEEKLGADPKARPAAWAWGLYRKAEALMAMGDFLGAVKAGRAAAVKDQGSAKMRGLADKAVKKARETLDPLDLIRSPGT